MPHDYSSLQQVQNIRIGSQVMGMSTHPHFPWRLVSKFQTTKSRSPHMLHSSDRTRVPRHGWDLWMFISHKFDRFKSIPIPNILYQYLQILYRQMCMYIYICGLWYRLFLKHVNMFLHRDIEIIDVYIYIYSVCIYIQYLIMSNVDRKHWAINHWNPLGLQTAGNFL